AGRRRIGVGTQNVSAVRDGIRRSRDATLLLPRGALRRRRLPVARHLREVDQRLAVARRARVLDLIVEAAAGFLRERDAHRLRVVAGLRTLHVLRERGFRRVAFLVALREHLLHEAEAVVTDEHAAAGMTAHREQAAAKRVEVAAREGDVLTGMIAVPLDEPRHLRLSAPIDAFDERDAELAVI